MKLYFTFFCVLLILTACAQREIPVTMNINKIEVLTVSVEKEESLLLTITDPQKIGEIITTLNKLNKTPIEEPEQPGNLYRIHLIGNKNQIIIFEYNDLVTHSGKLYSDKSANREEGWKVTEAFANSLLGEKRKPVKYK